MISLGKIQIEEFGSIKELSYNFNRRGLNTILGPNGSGKTSLLNALTWVIYKQLLKKNATVHPWPQFVGDEFNGTKVELDFWDENNKYKIIRCLEYKGKVLGKTGKNRLVFLINGKEVIQKGKLNVQQEINKTIGYTFDLFKSAVVFGQKMKRFMEEDGPAKKKIFEEAFDSAFIGRARELVQKRLDLKQKEYERESISYEADKSVYRTNREAYVGFRRIAKVFKENQLKKIKEHNKKAKELKNQIGILEASLAQKNLPNLLRTVEGKEADLKKLKNQMESKEFDFTLRVHRAQTDVEKLKEKGKELAAKLTEIPKKCSKCGSPIPKAKRMEYRRAIHKEIEAFKVEVEKEREILQDLKDKHEICKITLKNIEPKLRKVRAKLAKLEKANLKITSIKESIKTNWALYYDQLKQVEELRKEKTPVENLKQQKADLIKAKANLRKKFENLKQSKKAVGVDKWLIQDPLSNTGLKAFIFDSMMSKVNNYLRAYKSLIGFEVQVNVDLKSARKDIDISITRNGDEVPYEDLSGGQGQLVGVVVLFALNDTVNSAKPINILLMDEAFESLDKNNIPVVENIIQKKGKNRAIHLITHNDNFNPVGAYRTMLELVDGRTRVISRFRDN